MSFEDLHHTEFQGASDNPTSYVCLAAMFVLSVVGNLNIGTRSALPWQNVRNVS
jgi:hypothetical protein